jgi:hypothetical protein
MKKIINLFFIIAFAILSLFWIMISFAFIFSDLFFVGLLFLISYFIIVFLIYAAKLKHKNQLKIKVENNKPNLNFEIDNYDEDYENDEDDEDDDLKSLYNTNYGQWKRLSFGYGKFIKLTGVTFDNRQDNIALLNRRDTLTARYYDFKGKPAVEIMHDGLSIGSIPKEEAEELTLLQDYCTKIVVSKIIGGNDKSFGVIVDFRLSSDATDKLNEIYT